MTDWIEGLLHSTAQRNITSWTRRVRYCYITQHAHNNRMHKFKVRKTTQFIYMSLCVWSSSSCNLISSYRKVLYRLIATAVAIFSVQWIKTLRHQFLHHKCTIILKRESLHSAGSGKILWNKQDCVRKPAKYHKYKVLYSCGPIFFKYFKTKFSNTEDYSLKLNFDIFL